MRLAHRITKLQMVGEGEIMPCGYGIAWYEPRIAVAVCLPIPLNVIAGWARKQWHRLRAGVKPSVIDEARDEAWRAARRYNYQEMRARVQRDLDYEFSQQTRRIVEKLERVTGGLVQ